MIKDNLTVKERVILHLSEFTNLENERLLPMQVTQLGMADVLDIRQGHISRAVKELEDKAIVVGRQGYVQGAPGRRKVYLITYKGLVEARAIKDKLLACEVLFRDDNGDITHVKLDRVYEEVRKHVSMRFSDLMTMFVMSADEVVSVEDAKKFVVTKRLSKVEEDKKSLSLVDFSGSAPRPKHFFGRAEEIAQIKGSIDSGVGVNVIVGMAGIGKTALAWRIMREYSSEKNIFWYQFHKWSTLRHMLLSLSDFMCQMGITDLKSYLDGKDLDISDVVEILKKSLAGSDTLLVFDDFHESTDRITDLFAAIVSSVHEISKFSIIITTRRPVPFYDRRDVTVRKAVSELQLKGLDEQSVTEIMKERKGWEETDIGTLYKLTEGHPLFLELLKAPDDCFTKEGAIKFDMSSDVQKFIYEEIFAKLSIRERKLIEVASVFRYPFPPSAVFLDEDVDYNTLDSLVERCLLTECPENLYDTHEMIKSFFYERLPPASRQRYHLNAAKVYSAGSHLIEADWDEGEDGKEKREKEGEPAPGIDEIESMHHYLRAGHEELATELAIRHGRELIARGYLVEFMAVLHGIEDAKGRLESQVKDLKAEILSIWGRGEWDVVMEYHVQSKFLSESLGLKLRNRDIHEIISSSKRRDEDWARAITDLEKSIEALEGIDDEEGKSTLRKALAWTYWMKRDVNRAKQEYATSAKCANATLAGKALVELGNLCWEEGEFADAEQHYEHAIEKLNDDKFECARAHVHLGDLFAERGEVQRAMESYNKAMDICYKTSFMQGTAYVHLHMAQALNRDSKYRETAREYVEESARIFDRLHDDVGMGYAAIASGVMMQHEDPYKALELLSNGLKSLSDRTLDMPFYVLCAELSVARLMEKHAGHTMAEKHYDYAREMLKAELSNAEKILRGKGLEL